MLLNPEVPKNRRCFLFLSLFYFGGRSTRLRRFTEAR